MRESRKSVTPNGELIDSLRKRRAWTIERMAHECDIGTRTCQKALSGHPVSIDVLQNIADGLSIDGMEVNYESLLAERIPSAVMSVLVVIEVDMTEMITATVAKFVDLLTRMLPTGSKIVIKDVRAGSVIVSLEMSQEDLLHLVELFSDFQERAREAIRQTPEGEAYFNGVEIEEERAAGVWGLLQLVDNVRELRIQAGSDAASVGAEEQPKPAPTPGARELPSISLADSRIVDLRSQICTTLQKYVTATTGTLDEASIALANAYWQEIVSKLDELSRLLYPPNDLELDSDD